MGKSRSDLAHVDEQVDRVLDGGFYGSDFNENTVIIFTPDHGDYAGSHGIHAKGGAAYDECLNVPLYVSFPSMRSAENANNGSPIILPYSCSSVDLMPFLYALALGNEQWRFNTNDLAYHLRGRESILDAIYRYSAANSHNTNVQQHRLTLIPLANPTGTENWEKYQPFSFHTADDYPIAITGNNINNSASYQPSHVIAFRTVDRTDINNNSAPFYPQNSYGGGKLGIYGYWDTCDQTTAPPIKPLDDANNNASNQYEFYYYSTDGNLTANPQEVGNQYFDSNGSVTAAAADYMNNWQQSWVQNELYQLQGDNNSVVTQQIREASNKSYQDYIAVLTSHNWTTGSDGRISVGCTGGNMSLVDMNFNPL